MTMRSLILLLLFLIVSFPALAWELFLSEKQLNPLLQAGFPVQYQSGDHRITLKDPVLELAGEGQKISLRSAVAVDQGNASVLRGKATVEGRLAYSKKDGQIHLIKPTLTRLDVDQVDPAFEDTAKQVRSQLLSKPLPMILLLDLKQFTSGLPTQSLSNILVRDGALVFQF